LFSSLRNKLTKKTQNLELQEPASSETSNLSSEETDPNQKGAERRYDVAAIFIAVVFFFSWLPYILISRVTFIYHFYVAMPFLCLSSAYFINKYWNTKWGKVAAIAFFASVVVMFALFYPVISGVPTSTSWMHNLKWLPGWYFAP